MPQLREATFSGLMCPNDAASNGTARSLYGTASNKNAPIAQAGVSFEKCKALSKLTQSPKTIGARSPPW